MIVAADRIRNSGPVELQAQARTFQVVFFAKLPHGDVFAVDDGEHLIGDKELLDCKGDRNYDDENRDGTDDGSDDEFLQPLFSSARLL